MGETALLIFSICMQAAIGIMVFAAIAKLLDKGGIFKIALITAAGLAIVGLLASLLHLGRPLAAINALANFGSSWLSREIWFSSAFAGVTFVAALMVIVKSAAKTAINVLTAAAAIIGLADVYVMASAYHFASVPAWQHNSIYVEFYAAAISMGAALFLISSLKEATNMKKYAVIATSSVVILQVIAMVLFYIDLGANHSLAAQQSVSLLNGMNPVMILQWLFILGGTGLLFLPGAKQINISAPMSEPALETAAAGKGMTGMGLYITAAALLILGQIAGRYIFYAIMVSSKVGLS